MADIDTMSEAEIRERAMKGRAHIEVFARAINKTPQTVCNYIAEGMPADYFDKTPFVIVDPGHRLAAQPPA